MSIRQLEFKDMMQWVMVRLEGYFKVDSKPVASAALASSMSCVLSNWSAESFSPARTLLTPYLKSSWWMICSKSASVHEEQASASLVRRAAGNVIFSPMKYTYRWSQRWSSGACSKLQWHTAERAADKQRASCARSVL